MEFYVSKQYYFEGGASTPDKAERAAENFAIRIKQYVESLGWEVLDVDDDNDSHAYGKIITILTKDEKEYSQEELENIFSKRFPGIEIGGDMFDEAVGLTKDFNTVPAEQGVNNTGYSLQEIEEGLSGFVNEPINDIPLMATNDNNHGSLEEIATNHPETAGELYTYMVDNKINYLETSGGSKWGCITIGDAKDQAAQEPDDERIFVTDQDGGDFEVFVSELDFSDNSLEEQAGRTLALTQRGKNFIALFRSMSPERVQDMIALAKLPDFDENKTLTDTYLQQIGINNIDDLVKAKLLIRFNNEQSIMENKKVNNLIKKIEEATGKKVTLTESVDETITEASSVSSNTVGDVTVGEIIPAESQRVIEEYVAATLKELKGKIAELETIKFDVSLEAKASAEDWKQKTENVQFLIKQLERVSRFVNNTLIAKKFDKNILDKLVTLTPAEDLATSAPTPAEPMSTDLGAAPVM